MSIAIDNFNGPIDSNLHGTFPFELREYHNVPILSTQDYDYVVPDGATITLTDLGGNAPAGNNIAAVEIIWDPAGDNKIVFATYNAGFQFSQAQFQGDGVKVLRFRLINTVAVQYVMGGYVRGSIQQ